MPTEKQHPRARRRALVLDSVVSLEEELARVAGEISFARKQQVQGWGMVDSIILATARRSGSRIFTGDPHFKDLVEETVLL